MSPRVIPSLLGRRETQLLLANYFALTTSFYDSLIWRLAKANPKMETTQSGLTSLNNSGNWRMIAYSFQCFIPEVQRRADYLQRGPVCSCGATLYFVDSSTRFIPHLMFVVCGCSPMKAETTLGTGIDSVVGKLLETWYGNL